MNNQPHILIVENDHLVALDFKKELRKSGISYHPRTGIVKNIL